MSADPRPSLRTARLLLRPFVESDAGDYAALRYHPAVDAWLMPAPADDAVAAQRAQIAEYDQRWTAHGCAPWAVVEIAGGRLVGHCGLRRLDELDLVDMIWTMHPDTQGKGYAKEAAAAALVWGFANLPVPRLGALIRPDNARSQSVARSLGMTVERRVERRPGQWRDIWVAARPGGVI
ncbi:MAG: GNAT family N-acetyltransferase [Rhodospirillales bacterium]|nr:GNAT family N-acetyltransferase [Rhodospirillales bacterium]